MKALLLKDREVQVVERALELLEKATRIQSRNVDLNQPGAASSYAMELAEIQSVQDIAAKAAIQLGGLDGVLVTFGDGADGDTWQNLFGYLAEKGYCLKVTRSDGRTVEGFCTDIDDGEAGLVLDEIDEDSGDGNGILHGTPVPEVAGIHIY